ncbi:hypothetical protein M3649_08950 [Ureibacillus chungkukjangi]|uniref:hypothetical protein n=1 Tax=Ureibacillus chungkukjangi TaxID=1202712 RepID=UPI0020421A9B|nr:hypothetical protein [Ureibacillus chungkukjangi]MCM3388260.1 hypothetical protein [Ureibacillus chungkukjangi]
MKKVILSLVAFWILLGALIFYSEFRMVNFVHAFLSDPEELSDKVKGVTIWGEGENGTVQTLAILNPSEEKYEEVLAALNEWEVKRTLFSKQDSSQSMYRLYFSNKEKPINPYDILITSDGILNIHGREYKLVSGSSIEELIYIAR